MSRMRVLSRALVLVLTAFILAAPVAAQIREAEDLVEQTTEQMLVLIEDAKGYVDQDPERFYVAVEALLNPVIDFPRFARSVMAAHTTGCKLAAAKRSKSSTVPQRRCCPGSSHWRRRDIPQGV